MAEVRVLVNGNEYTEEQFRKDLIRMLDVYRDKDAQMGVPECSGVECYVCPLYKNSCCKRRTTNSFKTIVLVYNWAQEHPVVTNHDKLIKTFGNKNFNFILSSLRNDMIDEYGVWLNEEYKEPQEEKEK